MEALDVEALEQMVQTLEVPEVLHLHFQLPQLEAVAEVVVIQALEVLVPLEEELLEDFQEVLVQVILPQLVHLKEVMADLLEVLHLTQELAVEELLLQAVTQQEETVEMAQQVQSMHLQ